MSGKFYLTTISEFVTINLSGNDMHAEIIMLEQNEIEVSDFDPKPNYCNTNFRLKKISLICNFWVEYDYGKLKAANSSMLGQEIDCHS